MVLMQLHPLQVSKAPFVSRAKEHHLASKVHQEYLN